MLMQSCREIKTLFTEMREWASKALGFAKLLRKDLEIAAEFRVKVKSADLMEVLHSTGHVKVCYLGCCVAFFFVMVCVHIYV